MNYTFSSSSFFLAGLLLVSLKLGHQLDWSWWIILMPFYVPLLITVGLCLYVAWVMKNLNYFWR